MVKQRGSNPFFYLSLFAHVIFLFILIISIQLSAQNYVLKNSDKNSEIINAVVIDSKAMTAKTVVKAQQPPPPTMQQPPRVIPMEKPREIPIKKDVIAIDDKKRKRLQQKKIEQQLLAELKKQKDIQKKLQHKKMLNSFEKEMKTVSAKALQKQLLQEQQRVAGALAQETQGIVDKYKALILQAIGQHWLVPPNVNKKLSCELLIRVAPGGIVLDVQLIKSSGDEALDHSARTAVFKASPLPVPTETDAFAAFREFVLKVKPENVLTKDNWTE